MSDNLSFSQRIGKTPIGKNLQIESMDAELRNSLWNCIKLCIFDSFDPGGRWQESDHHKFATIVWHHFYKLPVDAIPEHNSHIITHIRDEFFKWPWFRIYDFMEFIVQTPTDQVQVPISFQNVCNSILEREFSGYRFIDGILAPISNELESAEVSSAIETTSQFSAFKGSNIHLQTALSKLSDKKSPDYRNSIKESVSAVESAVKIIAGGTKDDFGACMTKLRNESNLHQALEQGFKKIYGYTSDGNGIRHALMDDPNCDFNDAKFMLIACSAFINYLVGKSQISVKH